MHSLTTPGELHQSLILSCPVNSRYKILALILLEKNSEQDTNKPYVLNRGLPTKTVARADNEARDSPWEQETVSLISTPYFLFRQTQSKHATTGTSQPLFSSQYGNGVGSYRDKLQVLPETQKWLGKERIHVGWMKSLLIGPGKCFYLIIVSSIECLISACLADTCFVFLFFSYRYLAHLE